MRIDQAVKILESADACKQTPCLIGVHGIGKSEVIAQYAKDNDMYAEVLMLSMMDVGDMLGIPETTDVGGFKATTWCPPKWYIDIVNNAWPETIDVEYLEFNDHSFEEYFNKEYITRNKHISRQKLNGIYSSFYGISKDKLQLLRQDNIVYKKAKRSVLFLDEFNRAPQDILNASLELVLNHKFSCHELPIVDGKETFVVVAINPADEGYSVQEFDPALLDRFLVCPLEPDLKEWVRWAKNNNVNSSIIEFLTDSNEKMFHSVPQDGSKGTSPRSWVNLSKYINYIEYNGIEPDINYITGIIGIGAGIPFLTYYNGNSSITFDKVHDKVLKLIKKEEQKTVKEISKEIEELVTSIDPVKRVDYASEFSNLYIDKPSYEDVKPLMVYLYSLPLETWTAVVSDLYGEKNQKERAKLVSTDLALTGTKELFGKSYSNLKVDTFF